MKAVATFAVLLLVGCATERPTPVARTGPDPGEAVYQANCATCHDYAEDERTPPKAHLMSLDAAYIRTTLTEGVMKPLAEHLSPTELNELIAYLTAKP